MLKDKDLLFQEKSKIRKSFTEEQGKSAANLSEDENIFRNSLLFFKSVEPNSVILSYLNTDTEFDSWKLIETLHLHRPDLIFYAPRVETTMQNGAIMNFYQLNFIKDKIDQSKLEHSAYGLLEPKADPDKMFIIEPSTTNPASDQSGKFIKGKADSLNDCPAKQARDLELIYLFMPGVAFDSLGNRLGHGAGYYDRYLTRLINSCYPSLNIAPVRSNQCSDSILPTSTTDIKVDILINSQKIILCNPAKYDLLSTAQKKEVTTNSQV